VFACDLLQCPGLLVHHRQDSLGIVFIRHGAEKVHRQGGTIAFALDLFLHQSPSILADQLIWGINQRFDPPARFDGFADMMDPFYHKQTALLPPFTLPQSPDLFDKWITGTRNDFWHALILLESTIISHMRKLSGLFLLLLVILSACQTAESSITLIADGHTYFISTASRTPKSILAKADLTLGPNDRLLVLGSLVSIDTDLPVTTSSPLTVRRAEELTLIMPAGQKTIQTSALTVGQAMLEAGFTLYAADRFDPPVETSITGPITVKYTPSQSLVVTVDGLQKPVRSGAQTIRQALAESGLPLIGLDISIPSAGSPLPSDGKIRITRVTESVALTQKSIPFSTRNEASADLELDQQALLQGGEPGLAVARQRTRSQDGLQISQKTETESIIRPPQDRILGYGTKVVVHSAVVDGVAIQYYRVLTLTATSYSPCRSGAPDGRCSYGTSSGLPVQRGTVAMVYSWYLAFGFDRLYIPGYGFATVGDVGGGPPGNHYWVDLAFSDADYQPVYGTLPVYFLAPVPANLVTILP
jgi:resuscitation-promoting factor RpfB